MNASAGASFTYRPNAKPPTAKLWGDSHATMRGQPSHGATTKSCQPTAIPPIAHGPKLKPSQRQASNRKTTKRQKTDCEAAEADRSDGHGAECKDGANGRITSCNPRLDRSSFQSAAQADVNQPASQTMRVCCDTQTKVRESALDDSQRCPVGGEFCADASSIH